MGTALGAPDPENGNSGNGIPAIELSSDRKGLSEGKLEYLFSNILFEGISPGRVSPVLLAGAWGESYIAQKRGGRVPTEFLVSCLH